eukprot:1391-Pelagococcus_subviridis.AAC.2
MTLTPRRVAFSSKSDLTARADRADLENFGLGPRLLTCAGTDRFFDRVGKKNPASYARETTRTRTLTVCTCDRRASKASSEKKEKDD